MFGTYERISDGGAVWAIPLKATIASPGLINSYKNMEDRVGLWRVIIMGSKRSKVARTEKPMYEGFAVTDKDFREQYIPLDDIAKMDYKLIPLKPGDIQVDYILASMTITGAE